jgi:tRNA pseudouridine38-40 synthase
MKPRFDIVAFWCWYRGQHFNGYQQQQNGRTVQGELLRAFSAVGLSRNPVVAGRTDKGVSARMQVLSARVEHSVDLGHALTQLNQQFPPDLGLHLAKRVPSGFHAAWSADAKEYCYVMDAEQVGDFSLLEMAASLIPGTRNYKAFHFKSSTEKERTVNRIDLQRQTDGTVCARFYGTGFARHMVRMLVGGISAVARGTVSLDVFRAGLTEAKFFYCPTAPAEPLTLWNVGYPEAVDPFTPSERANFPWALTLPTTP